MQNLMTAASLLSAYVMARPDYMGSHAQVAETMAFVTDGAGAGFESSVAWAISSLATLAAQMADQKK